MDMIQETIDKALWEDEDDKPEFPNQTPLLAHYTSINNFERIIEGEELWFANPLNMNDSEELVFGMNQGATEFRKKRSKGSVTTENHLYFIFCGRPRLA